MQVDADLPEQNIVFVVRVNGTSAEACTSSGLTIQLKLSNEEPTNCASVGNATNLYHCDVLLTTWFWEEPPSQFRDPEVPLLVQAHVLNEGGLIGSAWVGIALGSRGSTSDTIAKASDISESLPLQLAEAAILTHAIEQNLSTFTPGWDLPAAILIVKAEATWSGMSPIGVWVLLEDDLPITATCQCKVGGAETDVDRISSRVLICSSRQQEM